MSFFVAVVGLGFLIFVHEGGHFVAARLVGLKPRKHLGHPGECQPALRLVLRIDDQHPAVPSEILCLAQVGAERDSWLRRDRQVIGHRESQRAITAVAPDEARHEGIGRLGQQLRWGSQLGQPAAHAQHRNMITELDRLVDVMRNEHDRLAQLTLQAQELIL